MNMIDFLYYGLHIHPFELSILDYDYDELNESAIPYKIAVDMILTGYPLI